MKTPMLSKRFPPTAMICLLIALVNLSPNEARAAWLGTAGAYRFVGAGFGHGIGMSQYGAKGMAEVGYSYPQILGHYYQGTAIASMPQPSLRVHIRDVGYAPSGISFYTSATVLVTVEGTGIYHHVDAPTTNPAVFSADDGGMYLSQGATLIAKTTGTFVLRFDPELEVGIGSLIELIPPKLRYRYGRVEITRQTAISKVRAVMTDLPMEKYLYGLGEVPNTWPPEAQKAQATAGRTYALEKVTRLGQNRQGCSCGLYSTVKDQNYEGYEKEVRAGFQNWKSAVDTTASQVVTYAGKPIEAYYSSSSGGYTENSENVFSASLPYLRGVPDPWDDAVSPHRWTRSYSGADLQRWLKAKGHVDSLFGIEVLAPYGVSGRVAKTNSGGGIRILDTSLPAKDLSADTFRAAINSGLISEGRPSEQLKSALFQLAFEPYPHGFRGGVFLAGGTHQANEIIATGADGGGGPEVVVSSKTGARISSFFAYDLGFTGGVRIAVCDLDADGSAEIVTAAGPGGGPHVRVFSATGEPRPTSFFAYAINFTGGVYVACANMDNVPGDEIVTGAGPGGGPHVRVFNASGTPTPTSFFPYDVGFKGGVRVAASNLDDNGPAEIVTGAGPGGGPHVKVFDSTGAPANDGFFPYDVGFTGGVYVAATSGGTSNRIVTGAGESGNSLVRVLTIDGTHVWELVAFGGLTNKGVRVGAVNGQVIGSTGTGAWPIVKLIP